LEIVVWQHRSVINHKLIHGGLFSRSAGLFLLATGLLAMVETSHAQEALRLSMAGDVAAATQQQYDNSIGYYNLLLGMTAWRFSSGLGLEYNSNVRLQENGESDLIIRPSINAQMHWPVTLKNSLDVSLGVGYSEYLQHSDLSQFYINPGSGLSFDVYSGDFKFNLHDQITITEEAYQNPGVSGGNQNLESLQNTAGASVRWDLNQAVANLGYDHANYVSLSQNQGEPDVSSENVFINGAIRVRPELLLGLEAGGSVITYSQTSQANAGSTSTTAIPNALQWNAGAFGSAQISDYLSVRLDAGYTAYTPDNAADGLVASDDTGLYFSLSLSHRVNRFLSYTLSAGRSTDLSAYGQAQSYYFVRVDSNWNIFNHYVISTPVWWQQGTRVYNTTAGAADYEQIGLGLSVTRALTQKLSASISYQFVKETSNQSDLTYSDNIVDLNLLYQF
jgi:hypothetical protein